MVRTDDPFRDFDEWDREREKWLSKRPVCGWCGEHIQEETALFINDEWMCERCEENHRRYLND